MKVTILDTAEDDLARGFQFYENQTIGLGAYFLDSLISDIESLATNAGIHPLMYGHSHKSISRRFPFSIYYQVEDDEIRVHSILDCRSDPAKIALRLT